MLGVDQCVGSAAGIHDFFFSDDDQFVIVKFREPKPETDEIATSLDIRFADSGQRRGLFRTETGCGYLDIAGDYALVQVGPTEGYYGFRVFNFKTLEEVPLKDALERASDPGAPAVEYLDYSSHFVLVKRVNGRCEVRRSWRTAPPRAEWSARSPPTCAAAGR